MRRHLVDGGLLLGGGLALAVTAALSIYALATRPAPQWDPLGAYATQVVTNPGRRVPLSGTLNIVATKCADETVQVRGELYWQSLDRPEIIVAAGQGVGTRREGCERSDYRNPIPDQVVSLYHSDALDDWQLAGTETPFDGSREGIPRAYQSQPIRLVGER